MFKNSFLFLIVILIVACSKKNETVVDPIKPSTLSVKVGSISKEASEVITTMNPYDGLNIKAKIGDKEFIFLGVRNPKVGSYTGSYISNPAIFAHSVGDNLFTDFHSGQFGTLSIISIGKDRVTGTFEFDYRIHLEKIAVLEGKFDAAITYE